jgi:phospholipid transport system substrate-binding protein
MMNNNQVTAVKTAPTPSSIANSRLFRWMSAIFLLAGALFFVSPVFADDSNPNDLIDRISQEVLAKIKADPKIKAGDFQRISALVDETIMPHVDFQRMTALAVGRGWRKATPDQREGLIKEFRVLLLRTYSGAMSQIKDETVKMKKLRAKKDATKVIVRSEIIGRGDPIQLNYRLQKKKDKWRIYDLNVLGVWLVETYRGQFKQITNRDGIDGLISTLAKKNKQFADGQK